MFNFSSSWLKRLALVVVVLTTATGCLRMDVAIRVEPDGTGTVEIEMLLSETLTELAEAFSDEDAGDPVRGVEGRVTEASPVEAEHNGQDF